VPEVSPVGAARVGGMRARAEARMVEDFIVALRCGAGNGICSSRLISHAMMSRRANRRRSIEQEMPETLSLEIG
jgi:hypothetical protein